MWPRSERNQPVFASESLRPTRMRQHIKDSFASTYLTIISIIQGVALSVLYSTLEPRYEHLDVAEWLMVAATLLLLVATWHLYVINALAYAWVLSLVDSLVPFLPAPLERRGKGITDLRSAVACGAGLILAGAHIAAHGPAVDASLPGHLPQRMTFARQRHDPCKPGLAPRFDRGVLALQAGHGHHRRDRRLSSNRLLLSGTAGAANGCGHVGKEPMLPRQEQIQRLPQILQEMESVGNVGGLGCRLACAVCKRPTPISA